MANCEISELVERCLAGDEAAVRKFVHRFERVVFALCLRMLRHHQDAEDAAQEALVRIIGNLHRWDQSRPLLPWMTAIAANRCRTVLAGRSRRPTPSPAVPETPAAEQAGRRELQEELQRAVDQLREEYRNVFELFYLQELSIAEISQLAGVPEGTVKTWLHRARGELAEILTRRGLAAERRHEVFRVS